MSEEVLVTTRERFTAILKSLSGPFRVRWGGCGGSSTPRRWRALRARSVVKYGVSLPAIDVCSISVILVPSTSTTLLRNAVTEERPVELGYALQLWCDFMSLRLWPNAFLNWVDVGTGAQYVAEFIQSLLDDHRLPTAAARRHLPNLRSMFIHHFGNTLIFDSDSINVLWRALALRAIHPDFHVAARSPNGGEQLPFTVYVLAAMYEVYWVDVLSGTQIVYSVRVNTLFRGRRGGQVADTGKSKVDHRYRIQDLSCELANVLFVNFLKCPPIDTVVLHCRSSKTQGPLHHTKEPVPPIVLFRG